MRYFLLLLITVICISQSVNAKDIPIIVEIFTYSGNSASCGPVEEDEFHYADGTHKEGVSENHHNKGNIPVKNIEDILQNLMNENPEIIALNFHQKQQPHIHDENGNDILLEPIEINEELNSLIDQRNYLYYKQRGFLDEYSNFQMVIGGQYKTSGTMKHVADAAIKKYKSEENPTTPKLSIKGNNLEIKLPESLTEKDLQVSLFGYKNAAEAGPNTVTVFKTLNDWNGKERQETVSITDMNADGFAILAQDKKTAKIYSAGKVER